jgi:DNA-binding XRE family transcriptional regulator
MILEKTVRRNDKKLHRLRFYREYVGLNQKDFALLLGYKVSNYAQKENGRTELKRSEMLKLQKAINDRLEKMGKSPVTLDEIFLP